MICPRCQSNKIVPHDLNRSGSQRYRCQHCKKVFTSDKGEAGRKRKYQSNADRQREYRKRKKEKSDE